ncbi:GNAT family N-acetyltransferase [Sagittula sp. NFXS13]|uniref:GNAT family N-acetyltransferase n=1 Tax=Sagittula sp. NFXS13 TaxID=2819095 RepID=UPI0032DE8628
MTGAGCVPGTIGFSGTEQAALPLVRGRYRARYAVSAEDMAAALELRARAFGLDVDADPFDALCTHVLVEDLTLECVVCCYRLLPLASGADIGRSYAAQVYDLSLVAQMDGPMLELGRFCLHPDHRDPDILRLAWAAMTTLVDAGGVALLFGCASFAGTDPGRYAAAFDRLRERHLAPADRAPGPKAAEVHRFDILSAKDPGAALRQMPPLLRTYLTMGGWVSDHAVVDHEMNTLHVFVGVEISSIPEARKRLLRAVVG